VAGLDDATVISLNEVEPTIDLLSSIVEIKAGTRGPGHPEPPHQRLIAMMAAAKREPVAVGKGGQIVRMRRVHHKANDSATFLGRSKHAQSGHFGHSLQGVSRKID